MGKPDRVGDGARAVLLIVGAGVAIILLGYFLTFWQWSHPSTSSEARKREQALLDLPAGNMDQAGLQLAEESSSAGSAASGFAADNADPVTVIRSYHFAGDALAACAAATTQLAAAGWLPDAYLFPCEPSSGTGFDARAVMQYQCEAFLVIAEVTAYEQSPAGSRKVVQVKFRTDYPDSPPGPRDLDPPSGYRGTTTTTTEAPAC